jgi:tetratricopeptide (TPR) repeat protein
MPSWLERLRDALAPGVTVVQEIASGGMGHVALGRDVELDRWLAIKVLQPEKATAVNAERFLREAQNAAGFSHPNVVQVHRTGEADGLFYYTMDYVDGPTLAQRLADGSLPPREVVRLGLDLLAALSAAHARNLIHRDVKPSNIFLTPDRALLGDFGIACDLASDRTALTRSGELIGTLRYLAPEQLRSEQVTALTDIYAAGLVLFEAATGRPWWPQAPPEHGDWRGVPKPLRAPIRRALQGKPKDRWPSAAAFAEALAEAEDALPPAGTPGRWRPSRRMGLIASAAAAVVAAAVIVIALWPRKRAYDLAIVPFGTAGLADTSVGIRLSGLTGWSFERLTDLKLTPWLHAIRRWHGSTLPPARRLEEVVRTTGSRYGAWGLVRQRGIRLEVQLLIVRDDGKPMQEHTVVGDSADLPALGDAVAHAIIPALFSDRRSLSPGALAGRPPAAQTEFLLGEEAFARDAFLTAERHYLRALQLDPSFILAAWRLGNARRWMPLRSDPPYPPGLFRLFEAHREALPEVDRHLIEAQFRSSGTPRFERYEQALAAASDDPYAALMYGDELFHRGPLAGRSLDDAVRLLEQAVNVDPTLAPAWEHLAWALIRQGERERAGHAVARLEALAARADQSEIPLPMFLRIAYGLRFGDADDRARAGDTLLHVPGALALAARGALSFDLPEAQAALGATLGATGETRDLRASGFTARGVALFALGRPLAALAAFDSAAALFTGHAAEARLQAAEWRVIPAALGAPAPDDVERARGRVTLAGFLEDSALGHRAAWALAIDSYARGDTTAANSWAQRIRSKATVMGRRLVPLLDGMSHAAGHQWESALIASEPALAYDSAGYAPDPFLRAALHLLRGEWLARLGQAAEADRAWLWYENLDVRAWPHAEAQPAEVDWALSTYARARRAGLAQEAGGDAPACALARRVREIWSGGEPAAAGAARELASLEQRCLT